MGVVSSMTTAISGLEANGAALGVISDNIVNANTTGFKSARGEFQSVLGMDMGGGSDIGRGTQMGGVTTLFNQGAVTKTDRGTDLAVNGQGFFILKGDNRGMAFTRDGSFRFDKEGWLTSLSGQRVQVFQASNEGKITQKLSDIRLPFNSIPAKGTNKIEMHVNLDARLPVNPPLDLTRPDETGQFTSGVQIFDSVGNAHAVSVYFNKTQDSTWEWTAMTDGGNLAGGVEGVATGIAKGKMNFDMTGKLVNSEQEVLNTSFANGAVPNQALHFDFGKSIAEGGTGQDGTTQYGSKSSLFRNIQDGWSAGYLADTVIDGEGFITGVYTNGQNKILGQVAMARFEANEKLAKVGDNQYRETIMSGQPNVGKPNSNGRGAIMTKSLENSNVDLAKEFVDMIKAQRGFQASAKSITTANEMLDEVIKLTRG